MRKTSGNSARRLANIGLFAVALTLAVASSTARADVLISSGATVNIACVSGVCTPTKKNAILNVGQLQGLLASGNVKVTTDGAKASDILITANLSWASAYSLTLDAFQSITVNKAVSANGTGALTLTTNDGGTGGLFSFGPKGHVTFLSTANSLTINGAAYTLVADTTTLANDIVSNPSGNYALASDYNASGNPSYVATTFNGNFQGLGNTISNLTITSSNQQVGLFAEVGPGGTVSNLTMTTAIVTVNAQGENNNGAQAGILVGLNQGLLESDSVSGHVRGQNAVFAGGLVGYNNSGTIMFSASSASVVASDSREGGSSLVGGLVGYNNSGSISESYATGNVKSMGRDADGGLVGDNIGGIITSSYATGDVSAGRSAVVGGLAGANASSTNSSGSGGTIKGSYSTGSVTAGSGSSVGGLVGGEVTADPDSFCYWDTTTSGITNPSQGAGNTSNEPGITGLSTAQLQAGLPAGFSNTIWDENPNINGGLPYLLALPPA